MPLYGYCCDACSHQFDALRKMADPDPQACPRCGGVVKRELSAPHFRLAGSGWYETDFKRSGETRRHLAEAPAPVSAPERPASRPRP